MKRVFRHEKQDGSKPSVVKRFALNDGDLMWGDYDLIFPVMDLYHSAIVVMPFRAAANRAV